MKSFSKILALGVVFAASSSLALADQISANGFDTYTNTTITFQGPYAAGGGTGIFSVLDGGAVSFVSGPLDFTSGTYPSTFIYSITGVGANAGDTIDFYATSDTYSIVPYDTNEEALTVNGSGYYTSNFFSGNLPGGFTITSQGEPVGGSTSVVVTFSGTGSAMPGAVTPEPNSLILLGTGLVGAAGMLLRRRNANGIV